MKSANWKAKTEVLFYFGGLLSFYIDFLAFVQTRFC